MVCCIPGGTCHMSCALYATQHNASASNARHRFMSCTIAFNFQRNSTSALCTRAAAAPCKRDRRGQRRWPFTVCIPRVLVTGDMRPEYCEQPYLRAPFSSCRGRGAVHGIRRRWDGTPKPLVVPVIHTLPSYLHARATTSYDHYARAVCTIDMPAHAPDTPFRVA
jgi:hypothetical protein